MGRTKYRYRIKSTGRSSSVFGPCEICREHVSEVFFQVEEMRYQEGWTRWRTQDLFGHESCLIDTRKPEVRSD